MEKLTAKSPSLDIYPSGTARFSAATRDQFDIEAGQKVSFFEEDGKKYIEVKQEGDYTISEDKGNALRFNPSTLVDSVWGEDRDETLKFDLTHEVRNIYKLTPTQ